VLLASAGTAQMSAPPDTTPPAASTPEPAANTTLPPADHGTFAVQPSGPNGPGGRDYFIYTLKPGDTYGDTVGISNFSDHAVTYAIYATDALNTRDGGLTLLRPEQKPVDVGTWVQTGVTQYTVEAGQRADVPFKVTVPADATPGDHVGAIVAQPIPDSAAKPAETPSVDVSLRIGARVYVRVSGPINASLSVSKFSMRYDTPASPFSGRKAVITYTVTNTGNIRLSPLATLRVAGILGLGGRKVPERKIPELLPGSSLEISESVSGVRPYGRLTAALKLAAPNDGVTVRRGIDVWTVPWLGLVVLALVVGALVFWFVRRRRRRRSPAVAT
jgi:hypothetical protein